jgi:hypothetical protein
MSLVRLPRLQMVAGCQQMEPGLRGESADAPIPAPGTARAPACNRPSSGACSVGPVHSALPVSACCLLVARTPASHRLPPRRVPWPNRTRPAVVPSDPPGAELRVAFIRHCVAWLSTAHTNRRRNGDFPCRSEDRVGRLPCGLEPSAAPMPSVEMTSSQNPERPPPPQPPGTPGPEQPDRPGPDIIPPAPGPDIEPPVGPDTTTPGPGPDIPPVAPPGPRDMPPPVA